MKKSIRDEIKKNRSIISSTSKKVNCSHCLYHNKEKICQIHGVKTYTDEVCDSFSPMKKHKVFQAGRVSPK